MTPPPLSLLLCCQGTGPNRPSRAGAVKGATGREPPTWTARKPPPTWQRLRALCRLGVTFLIHPGRALLARRGASRRIGAERGGESGAGLAHAVVPAAQGPTGLLGRAAVDPTFAPAGRQHKRLFSDRREQGSFSERLIIHTSHAFEWRLGVVHCRLAAFTFARPHTCRMSVVSTTLGKRSRAVRSGPCRGTCCW